MLESESNIHKIVSWEVKSNVSSQLSIELPVSQHLRSSKVCSVRWQSDLQE